MRLFVPLILFVCLLVAGCTDETKPPRTPTPTPTTPPIAVDHSADPIKIVVSLPIFADMVREIGGDQVKVTSLIPPGVDPHTYVPSEDLAQATSEALIIFYNGNNLEPPTQQFIEAHQSRPLLVINFTHNIPSPSTQQPLDKPIYAEQVGDDPHLFLDPELAAVYPASIADSLAIKDGPNAAYYNARFVDYKKRIDEMGQRIRDKLNTIPQANKGLLVLYHNSLIHFENRYGLAIAGTVVDNGADGLAQVLATKHPPAVFAEAGYDTTVLTQVAQTAGIPVCHLQTDSVNDLGLTYIKMMEDDTDELVHCLS